MVHGTRRVLKDKWRRGRNGHIQLHEADFVSLPPFTHLFAALSTPEQKSMSCHHATKNASHLMSRALISLRKYDRSFACLFSVFLTLTSPSRHCDEFLSAGIHQRVSLLHDVDNGLRWDAELSTSILVMYCLISSV